MSRPAQARHRHTWGAYLGVDEGSDVRHEFLDGEIYAMAGGTPEHAALGMAFGSALVEQLRGGPCRVYSSDLRVRVLETGLASYPDVTVVCGPVELDGEGKSAVNPTVVVEVTSESTEAFDRGEKLAHYQRIPSLRAGVIVSHRERQVEVWERGGDGAWQRTEARSGRAAAIAAIGCRIDVDALYDTALGAGRLG
jgi:Uma2 family endonuclease